MRAALVVSHSMDLVTNYGLYIRENAPASLRCQQYVERLRSRNLNVWRTLEHLLPLVHQRVASADSGPDLRHQQPFFAGEHSDLRQGTLEILLNVIAQRLER